METAKGFDLSEVMADIATDEQSVSRIGRTVNNEEGRGETTERHPTFNREQHRPIQKSIRFDEETSDQIAELSLAMKRAHHPDATIQDIIFNAVKYYFNHEWENLCVTYPRLAELHA